MHQPDTANTVPVMPTAQPAGTPGWFPTKGTVPPALLSGDLVNTIVAELKNVIVLGAGLTLDKTNNTQLLTAIRSFRKTWRRTIPLGCGASVHYTSGDSGDVLVEQTGNLTKVSRTSADGCGVQIAWPIPADARGLQYENSLLLRVKLATGFTGTASIVGHIYRIEGDGSTTSLGSVDIAALTPGASWQLLTNAHLAITPFVLDEGEGLYFQVNVSLSGGGAGEVQFSMLSLALEEDH